MMMLQINIGTELGSNIVGNYPNVASLVTIILKNSLTVAGVILVGLLVFGGVSYIAAAGEADQKKLAAAQDTLTSALIGFLVVFASYFIIQIVQVITGLTII